MGWEQRRDGQIIVLRKAGTRPALPGPAANSEIRVPVSREHRTMVRASRDRSWSLGWKPTRPTGCGDFHETHRDTEPLVSLWHIAHNFPLRSAPWFRTALTLLDHKNQKDGPASRRPPQERANSFAEPGTSVFRLVRYDPRQSNGYIRQSDRGDQLPKDHVLTGG
jgi:hypothetical protein